MPFYIRQSVSVGPFRFNLSKSGVGMSVGIRGMRVGTGPKGNYIHMGAGGIYYRAALRNRAHGANVSTSSAPSPVFNEASQLLPNGLIEIESAPTWSLAPTSARDLLTQITEAQRRNKLSPVVGALAASLVGFALYSGLLQLALVSALLGLALFAVAARRDASNKVVLLYDLEDPMRERFGAFCAAFDAFSSCSKTWHIDASGRTFDWKRNAGASSLITRKRIEPSYALPSCIASNINVPSLPVGKQTLFFFPDRVLVIEKGSAGAVEYDELAMDARLTNMIEEESVPTDTRIVGHTWRFVNKGGGPDRRFNNNRQIPICVYDALHLRSPSGLNELVNVSRPGAAVDFARASHMFIRSLSETKNTKALPPPVSIHNEAPSTGYWRRPVLVAMVLCLAVAGGARLVLTSSLTPTESAKDVPAAQIGAATSVSVEPRMQTVPRNSAPPTPPAPAMRQVVAPPPPPTDTATDTNTTMEGGETSLYATARINLRSSPSTSAPIVTRVDKGLEVLSLAQDGPWRRVRVGSFEGWAHGDYLASSPPRLSSRDR